MESQATSPAYPASLPQGLAVALRGALSECPSHMAGVSSPFVPDIGPQEREDARVGPRAPHQADAFTTTLPIRAKQRPR